MFCFEIRVNALDGIFLAAVKTGEEKRRAGRHHRFVKEARLLASKIALQIPCISHFVYSPAESGSGTWRANAPFDLAGPIKTVPTHLIPHHLNRALEATEGIWMDSLPFLSVDKRFKVGPSQT